jgi:two-component sensor histidine kinase
MTGFMPLDWAIISVSLFNTVLLLWLGLTVLLTAEQRSLGVWLLDAGLLLGAGFFISHTAILGGGLRLFSSSLNFWWRTGWLPVIAAPLAWYGLILWFAGFWSPAGGALRRRHRLWLGAMPVVMLALLVVLYVGHGLPTFADIAQLDLSGILTVGGLPVLLAAYPVYMVACIVLAVDALRRPAEAERFMGDVARQRTYPWLLAASLTLLAVSVLVAWFMLWAISSARAVSSTGPPARIMQAAGWFDLGVEALIALAVVFIGQAIVSYEIFTGQSLPRRAFFRQWRDAIILAGGYALFVGGSITLNLNLIYSLLLTTMLMVAFYALFGWRSFVHRRRFMGQLRPFVGSQNLIDQLTFGGTKSAANSIFHALCDDVLGTTRAQLTPSEPLADLVGEPLVYPQNASVLPAPLPVELAAPPGVRLIALPAPRDGLRWAVELWATHGLAGVLLLGDKRDSGVYTQEEIEIAEAAGERLLDMLAGQETARRLMALQRRRLAETQILDHQTRRALHDEVLPELHTAILDIGASPETASAVESLTALHHRISDLIYTHPGVRFDEGNTDLVTALKRLAAAEFSRSFTAVRWHGADSLTGLNALAQEVLFYATREVLRNAALHGRGSDPRRDLHLDITLFQGEAVKIRVEDDGMGLPDGIDASEQGGWVLHSTMLALLGGMMTREPSTPTGVCVEITLPGRYLASTPGVHTDG